MTQRISWSISPNGWDAVAQTRARRKLDAQAYHIARQVVHGTLPENGVIACPDEYSAQQLLERVKQWLEHINKEHWNV